MWAKKGTRPILNVCRGVITSKPSVQKRDKVYIIGFVEPTKGIWISYLVPALNGDWYTAVLSLLDKHFRDKPIKLIVDRAGWHTGGDIEVPSNISLKFLPARSPELNPVEQIWEDVRYNHRDDKPSRRNKTFTDSQTLWNTLEQAMKNYNANPDKVKSIANQEWLYGKQQA